MTSDATSPSTVPFEQKAEPIAPPMGDVTASGFKWTLAFSIVSRVMSFCSSIVLAHLLLKGENGAYVEAFITVSAVSALRDAPLGPVLMARRKEFDELQSDAFWLSLALGLISGAIIAIVGYISWQRPDGHTVAKLLWMNAIASPLMTAGTVSVTKIQIHFRFALNAKIATVNQLATTLLTILLAAPPFRWGAYALMVPQVVLGILRAAYFLWIEPPQLQRRIDFRKMSLLALAGAVIVYTGLATQVIGQGDNFTIARHFNKDTVGLYGWAFTLSVQAIILLASSLGGVILPALAVLNDEPDRQIAGFLRMARTMAVLGIPFCALQILFAQPIVKPLFSAEWSGAEPIIRILSFGMAFAMVNGFSTQLMLARKQNLLLIAWSTLSMIAFMLLVYVGVRIGGPAHGVRNVAWGVAIYHAVVGTIGLRIVVGKYARLSEIIHIFWPPLLAAFIASGPAMTMAWLMPRTYHGDASLPITLLAITLFATIFCGVYALLIRSLAPEPWRELLGRIHAVTHRFGIHLIPA